MEGCRAKKGHWCQHTVTKCANCKGPHFAQANACPKKAARGDAKGWRSPSPTWRQRGKTSPPEEPPTDAQETPRGRIEVEEYEPASEEAMEEYGPRGGSDGRGVGWREVLVAPYTLPQARVTFLFSRVFLFGGWGPYYDRLGRSGARETVM